MKQKAKYDEQSARLVKAIDIAEQVINEFILDVQYKKQLLDFGMMIRHKARFPEPQFKKIASLKYLEEAFFTYWNESNEPYVEKFWNLVLENKLGYVRKDPIQDVLKRKRITNIHEFDFITDSIVIYEQTGRITPDQVVQLNIYLGEYEKSKKANIN